MKRDGCRHLSLTALCVLANAQDYRARVQGIVTDPSQGAASGAKMTLRNMGTGVETAKLNDHNEFSGSGGFRW
jgi:hypothetical protein